MPSTRNPLSVTQRLGVVTALVPGPPPLVTVQLGGDTSVSVDVPFLTGYIPVVNDVVVVIGNNGDWLVLATASLPAPGQVLATANTSTIYTGTSVTEASCPDLQLSVDNIVAGRNYWLEFSGRMVATTGTAVSGVTFIHALQGTVTTASPIVARRNVPAVTSTTADDFSLRQLWVPGASGTWNFLPGVKSGTAGTNVSFGPHSINSYFSVVQG